MKKFSLLLVILHLMLLMLIVCSTRAYGAVILKEPHPFRPKLPGYERAQQEKIVEMSKPEEVVEPLVQQHHPVLDQRKVPRPNLTKPVILPELDIKGLVWNSRRPQTIINDRVVDVGDHIANVKIISIAKHEIGILYQGRTMSIKP